MVGSRLHLCKEETAVLVRKWMSPDALTIQTTESISAAGRLVKNNQIMQLPALEGEMGDGYPDLLVHRGY